MANVKKRALRLDTNDELSDDNNTNTLLTTALAALDEEGDDMFDDGHPDRPPMSGSQYLKRVQLEASRCPDIVVAHIAVERPGDNPPSSLQCPPQSTPCIEGTPSLEHQSVLIAEFSKLRQNIERKRGEEKNPIRTVSSVKLPHLDDERKWCELSIGKTVANHIYGGESNTNDDDEVSFKNSAADRSELVSREGENLQPLLSVLLSFTQEQIFNLLEYHSRWIEKVGFYESQGSWIYSLLACVDKPLHPDVASVIRYLARLCFKLRSNLKSEDNDDRLVPLNIIIVIVARYFRQDDLAQQCGLLDSSHLT